MLTLQLEVDAASEEELAQILDDIMDSIKAGRTQGILETGNWDLTGEEEEEEDDQCP